MSLTIPCTAMFKDAYEAFDERRRKTIVKKIRLLIEHPLSSTLNAHRYDTAYNVWVCYIDHRIRLLYERLNGVIYLRNIGYHSILDRAGRYKGVNYTHHLNLDEEWIQLACSVEYMPQEKGCEG